MRAIAVTFVFVALAGCGRSLPTYDLIIGSTPTALPVRDDPQRMQDDLVSHLKPLWDRLQTGSSETFQWRRRTGVDLGPKIEAMAKAQYGPRVKVTTTRTSTSASCRFFKHRGGKSGIEQVEQGKEPLALLVGEDVDVDWGTIECELRTNRCSITDIRDGLQDEAAP